MQKRHFLKHENVFRQKKMSLLVIIVAGSRTSYKNLSLVLKNTNLKTTEMIEITSDTADISKKKQNKNFVV